MFPVTGSIGNILGITNSLTLKLYLVLFGTKRSEIYLGHNCFLTLYMIVAISCNLLFKSVSNLAEFNNSLYFEFQLQYTAFKPLSWTLSSFLESLALQKCHTVLQFIRCGSIAALNNCNLELVGVRFRKLINTPTLWLLLLQMALIWSVKESLLSIFTPYNEMFWLYTIVFYFKSHCTFASSTNNHITIL